MAKIGYEYASRKGGAGLHRNLVALIVVVSVLVAHSCLAQTPSHIRIAVMDFSSPSGASDRGYADSSRRAWGDPGRMMAELLTTHFVKSGRFDVVERARLYQLLNEKQINVGAGILGEQAKVIGAELGVQAIVVGGYQPGGYGYEVAARIVSVTDGSALASENALVPADPTWMDQSLGVIAAKLMAPWSQQRGYVLDVFLEPDRLPLLLVDLGEAQGAKLGREIEISTSGDPIIHPVTHENLGTRDVVLATAAVVEVQKEFCYARVMDRKGVTSTPIRADGEGIDLGIARMQRAKLSDEYSDAADPDVSVLAVCDNVHIISDVPEAKLLVDGKPTPLVNMEATARLGAGTHLIELQVGQSLLSREITISRQGARPKEVAFRKNELASAIAAVPPTPNPPTQQPQPDTPTTQPAQGDIVSFMGNRGPAYRPGLKPSSLGWGADDQPYPAKFVVNPRDGAEMVWVPAGQFTMGCGPDKLDKLWRDNGWEEKSKQWEPPPHPVILTRGFWLYRYEVTNGSYQKFTTAAQRQVEGWRAPFFQHLQFPVNCVSWDEAAAYSQWAGAALPTEAQWEWSARGPQGNLFPWGDTWDRSKCNNAELWAHKSLGSSEACNEWFRSLNFQRSDECIPFLKAVGSFPEGKSWCGALDLAGSVQEWCTDWYGYSIAPVSDPQGPATGKWRVSRGASWVGYPILALSGHRSMLDPVLHVNISGFRCLVMP